MANGVAKKTKAPKGKTDDAVFEQLVEAVEKSGVVNPAIYHDKEVFLLPCDKGYFVKDLKTDQYIKEGRSEWLTITKGQAVTARVRYIQHNKLEDQILGDN